MPILGDGSGRNVVGPPSRVAPDEVSVDEMSEGGRLPWLLSVVGAPSELGRELVGPVDVVDNLFFSSMPFNSVDV